MPGIQSIKLVLPQAVLDQAWIRFEDGLITAFGQGCAPPDEYVDGGGGRYVAPGFIDLHVHGGAGADFLDNTEEAFARISTFHLMGGTTSLCPTLATTTYNRIAASAETLKKCRTKMPGHLLPLHLEGPHLALSKAGAHDPKLLHPATPRNIQWLVEHASAVSQITVAPELPNSLELITRAVQAGIGISLGHSEADEDCVRKAVARGARKATHLFNAMSSSTKRGLFRQAGLVECALTESALTCELIGDGFHVPPTLAKIALQCKGTAGIALVSDALAGAGLPAGSNFMLGALSCRVEDGYCVLADGSALAGSATRLIDHVRWAVQKLNLPLCEAVRMATETPAHFLGLAGQCGSIACGLTADLVLFDDNFQPCGVWVAGRKFPISESY